MNFSVNCLESKVLSPAFRRGQIKCNHCGLDGGLLTHTNHRRELPELDLIHVLSEDIRFLFRRDNLLELDGFVLVHIFREGLDSRRPAVSRRNHRKPGSKRFQNPR